jgi:hypothetical protein
VSERVSEFLAVDQRVGEGTLRGRRDERYAGIVFARCGVHSRGSSEAVSRAQHTHAPTCCTHPAAQREGEAHEVIDQRGGEGTLRGGERRVSSIMVSSAAPCELKRMLGMYITDTDTAAVTPALGKGTDRHTRGSGTELVRLFGRGQDVSECPVVIPLAVCSLWSVSRCLSNQ